jgi:uncharacterized cupredoxin-like copper-binding protein
VVAVAVLTMAAACNGNGAEEPPPDDDVSATVQVELADFDVTPDTDAGEAGRIRFEASNVGAMPHELVVIRTDLALDGLPMEGAIVDENADEVEVVGEIEPFDPNSIREATFELESGSHVLICNISGHYQAGMHAAFTVE